MITKLIILHILYFLCYINATFFYWLNIPVIILTTIKIFLRRSTGSLATEKSTGNVNFLVLKSFIFEENKIIWIEEINLTISIYIIRYIYYTCKLTISFCYLWKYLLFLVLIKKLFQVSMKLIFTCFFLAIGILF